MTTMEFEGRTEREAIAKAVEELGSESFDVEILEKEGGLFSRGKVRIRVRMGGSIPDPMGNDPPKPVEKGSDPPSKKVVSELKTFLVGLVEKMGYSCEVSMSGFEKNKLNMEIRSQWSNVLIGKKGKTLDALQFLANVFLSRRLLTANFSIMVVLDIEGYRKRQEESLIRMARKAADKAVTSRNNQLLEPMNPAERRLVHRVLNNRSDVTTKSKGEGFYKRIWVMFKENTDHR